MAMGSMYMAMVLTNWANFNTSEDIEQLQTYDLGTESMWFKIASEWVAIAIYFFSLIAPYTCLKDRFDYN